MKKYIKYSIVFLIVVLSSFVISNNSDDIIKKDATASIVSKKTPEIVPEIVIDKYADVETEKVTHKLDSLLKRINKRYDFNGSILVAKNGKLVYENQVGTANFRKKSSLNSESIYQLASVSKQFTATSIMILKERNQLKLSDTITDYYPDFPFKNITIKNLLNHTSGLPKYFWVAEHEWKGDHAPSNSEMMNLLESSKVNKFFSPGRNFDYSNTGYFVLASIVEKVTKMPFSDFVQKNIFAPLQMKDTFVYSFEKDEVKANQLNGYRLYRGWRHLTINGTVNDAIVGDKNVYSTSKDLLKWVYGLNNEKIISKESLEEMYTKGETVYGRKIPYGLGFRIDTKNDEKVIYHYGKWNGFSTAISQYQDDDLVVIILEHTSYTAMSSLNKKVKNIVLDNFEG